MEYKVPTKVGMDISFRKIPSRQSRHALKIIVAMKLIALLFLFNLQVTASVYSQRISLTASNTPLREVLQAVRKQSGYSFFVESDNLRDSKPVNLQLMENSVPEALDKIFENQPFTYTIENNVIVVTRKLRTNLSAADFLTFDNGGPDSTKVVYVQGRVQDDKGQPLVGVSIRVKGGGTGTVTREDGTYSLKTNAAATLVFSYIGYLSREIKASQGAIDVVLRQLNTALDQVQVIAYGTTTKRTSTGNIATVNAEVIERQPVSNPLLALQGRIPGLFIEQSSGVSAGNINITIQGINSLKQGTSPFFVIDGVPYPPVNLDPSLMSGAISGGGGSTLTYINPSDIESITVLKDADATAIYGSRAANGAILITTKKGKPGKALISLNLQTGWGKIPGKINLMDTKDYISLRKEAKKNDNSPISPTSDYDISGVWDTTRNTNWQKELVGGTAHFTNLQGSVSGGTENTQYLVGGGYLNETTVYPGSMEDKKENVHMSLNHRSANKKFNFNFTGTYLQDDNTLISVDLMGNALGLPPNAPPLYSDGAINWGLVPGTNFYSFDNPVAYQLRKYKSSISNALGNVDVGYSPLPGLEIATSLGYNIIQANENAKIPQASFNPGYTANLRSSSMSNKSIATWNIEPKLKYKHDFDFGNIDLLIGSTFQQRKSSSLTTNGNGYINDAQIDNISIAPTITAGYQVATYRYTGLFGRLIYNYRDRYILTVAGRRDGTTRFGSANRFANFYSVAGAWLFSEEEFIKKNSNILSLGKIRMSYGTSGNDQIQDYLYMTLYNNIITPVPYQQTQGLQPAGHSNPYLQWELTKKLNIGLDLGIWNNQILFTGNYFINRSSNQLVSYPLGFLTGFNGIYQNINATIENKGLELQLDATPLKNKKTIWTISLNLTVPQNKLTKFDNLDKTTFAQSYVVGKSTSIVKVYPYIGVNPQTGIYEFMGSDGKPTSTPNNRLDRTYIIDLNPQFYGGLTNTFIYKGITLDFTLQFVKKISQTSRMTFGIPGTIMSTPTVAADRWKQVGDHATYQRATSQNSAAISAFYSLFFSAAEYEDASYIKLRNISLSYNIPQNWLKKIKITSAKIFVQGQNMLTFSNYFGLSPESSSLGTIPPLRIITTGFNINF